MFDKKETITLTVEGMSCGHCRKRVEDALNALKGVKQAVVSLEQKQATVTYSPAKVTPDEMKKAVRELGFTTP